MFNNKCEIVIFALRKPTFLPNQACIPRLKPINTNQDHGYGKRSTQHSHPHIQ